MTSDLSQYKTILYIFPCGLSVNFYYFYLKYYIITNLLLYPLLYLLLCPQKSWDGQVPGCGVERPQLMTPHIIANIIAISARCRASAFTCQTSERAPLWYWKSAITLKVIVCPITDCAAPVWASDPHQKDLRNKLEVVPRRSARRELGTTSSASAMVRKLNLDPLQLRHTSNKVTMMYKVAGALTNAKPRKGIVISTQNTPVTTSPNF